MNNPKLLKVTLITGIDEQKKNRIISKCGYKKYRNKLIQKQISGILKKYKIQVSCGKWSEEIHNNITELQKIPGKFQERISCN